MAGVPDSTPPSYSVAPPSSPTIEVDGLPGTLPSPANLTEIYSVTLTMEETDVELAFSVSAGSLPPGLTFVKTGALTALLSGLPTALGSYTFTLKVIGLNTFLEQEYTIVVESVAWVIEDGTGKVNATTYMDVLEFKSLLLKMGWPVPSLNNDELMALIMAATSYTERRWRFYGSTYTNHQALQWPRSKNYDNQGKVIAGGVIPNQLKQGIAMFAYQATLDAALLAPYMASTQGTLSSWSQNGTSVTYKKDEQAENNLFDVRLPDVEVILRSIGQLKPLDWLGPNLQTVVR